MSNIDLEQYLFPWEIDYYNSINKCKISWKIYDIIEKKDTNCNNILELYIIDENNRSFKVDSTVKITDSNDKSLCVFYTDFPYEKKIFPKIWNEFKLLINADKNNYPIAFLNSKLYDISKDSYCESNFDINKIPQENNIWEKFCKFKWKINKIENTNKNNCYSSYNIDLSNDKNNINFKYDLKENQTCEKITPFPIFDGHSYWYKPIIWDNLYVISDKKNNILLAWEYNYNDNYSLIDCEWKIDDNIITITENTNTQEQVNLEENIITQNKNENLLEKQESLNIEKEDISNKNDLNENLIELKHEKKANFYTWGINITKKETFSWTEIKISKNNDNIKNNSWIVINTDWWIIKSDFNYIITFWIIFILIFIIWIIIFKIKTKKQS